MNIGQLKYASALLLLSVGLTVNATAETVVFLEDGEGYPVAAGAESSPLGSAKNKGGVNWWSFSKSPGRAVVVERDSANRFGRGGQNHVLLFSKGQEATHPHNLVSNHFEPLAAGELAFDFYVPAGEIKDSPGMRVMLMNTSVDYAQNLADYKNNAVFTGLYLQDGRIRQRMLNGSAGQASIPFDSQKAHQLAIVFNNTSAPFAYANGKHTLAAGDMDVWLDNEKKATWPLNGTIPQEAAARVLQPQEVDALAGAKGLWINSNVPAELYLDNIRVSRQAGSGSN